MKASVHLSACFLVIHACSLLSTELLGDLLKEKPKEEEGVDKIIVVDNAPTVSA